MSHSNLVHQCANRPYSRNFELAKSNIYRSFILKLRRPKTGLEIGFSSLFLASMKDMIDGRLPAKRRNKLSRGRHVLGMLIFLRTPLEKHDSYKKIWTQPHYLNTQNNKSFTCIIITFFAYTFIT